MKYTILLAAFIVGCDKLVPVELEPRTQLAQVIYSSAIATSGKIVPNPNPKPDPSPNKTKTCPGCDGTGRQGDGTHEFTCRVCDGKKVVPIDYVYSTPTDTIKWVSIPEDLTLEKLRGSDKNIWITFGASWCKPCEARKSGIYQDLSFIELTREFHCIYVDVDKNPEMANVWKVSENIQLPVDIIYKTDTKSTVYDFFGSDGAKLSTFLEEN